MTYKFTVTTTHQASELISDAMFDLGAQGVSIVDPQDFDEIDKNGVVWDYITDEDKKGDVTVDAFFDTDEPELINDTIRNRLHFIEDAFPFPIDTFTVKYELVPEVNWMEEWKKYYKPIILDKISIIPSWEEPVGDNYIFIEPGQAFGTGEHESTNMCLRLSFNLDLVGKMIADVGCGSGIIGMSALKLGAKSCYFTDLDGDALDNLRTNLELNHFENNYTVKQDSLLTNDNGVYDIIFANITADILQMLAPQIESHLSEGGTLVISGIIASREDEVIECYEKHGYNVVDSLSMKDWRAFTLKRKNGN